MWSLPGTAALAFVLGMQSGTALAAPEDQDVFTDFETIDATDFSIGSGDVTATFTGGFSGVAGILELYRSGTHAWMVRESNTGEIQFETNAATVDFFSRARSTADGPSVLTAFDSQGQVVDSVTLNPGDPFEEVIFTGSIARIEFANNASEGCADCMNSIDDFGFSPVDASSSGPLAASVLPTSRSVQVGNTATAFAVIINAGSATATGCAIAAPPSVQADFSYQTTDASNALIGTPDTPVDIAAGGNQNYLFALTPTAPFSPVDVQLSFDCTNTDPAPVTLGLNTLLLVADSNPVPDIVALAATPTADGIVNLENNSGVFAVATVNVGVAGNITVSADTGGASLPVSIALCETDPATSVCINPTVPTLGTVTTSIAADATLTFAFFVTGTDTVPFDPANNRIFVRFQDAGGVTRGSTSVAVRTL